MQSPLPARLLIGLGGANAEQAGHAAVELFQMERSTALGQSSEAFFDVDLSWSGGSLTARAGHGTTVRERALSLDSIRTAVQDGASLLTVAGCCLVLGGEVHQYSNVVLSSAIGPADIESKVRTSRPTRRDDTIARALGRAQDVLLFGPSASGKTVSAALAAHTQLVAGHRLTWLDLSAPDIDGSALVASLVRQPRRPRHLVVIDNMQSNPSAASDLGRALQVIRDEFKTPLVVLGIGWNSARGLGERLLPGAVVVNASGQDVIIELCRSDQVSDTVAESISELAQGDVVLATTGLQYFKVNHRVPSLDEVTDLIADELHLNQLSPDARLLLYWFASLGSFEIDIPLTRVESALPSAVSTLFEHGVIRKDADSLTVGHRSLASLLVRYALRQWRSDIAVLDSPPRAAVNYLRGGGDRQIRATLEKLDLIDLAHSEADQHGSAFLARAWQALGVLGSHLAKQVETDPSWGNNLASAVFACDGLAELDRPQAWTDSASFVRTHWTYSNPSALPRPAGTRTSEWHDFPEIQKCMQIEDHGRGVPHWSGMAAGDIDLDRFHRTWALGLLLGFESSALDRDTQKHSISTLKAIAEREQEPTGAFYPSRVPWLTARVLMGLCRAGETYQSNNTVRRACDWLRTAVPNGPYSFGAWESGTGAWNTAVQTTAMCLVALGQAGIPIHDPVMSSAGAYLKKNRTEWTQPGKEIDLATAIEAYLAVGGRWREISKELSQLLAWAQDRDPWQSARRLASVSHTESSKVPYVASSLIAIVWATVKGELPLLLEGLQPWLGLGLEGLSSDSALQSMPTQEQKEAVQRALSEVRSLIAENVHDRRVALSRTAANRDSNSALQAQLRAWTDREAAANELQRRLHVPHTLEELRAIAHEVDALGQNVAAGTWHSIGSAI